MASSIIAAARAGEATAAGSGAAAAAPPPPSAAAAAPPPPPAKPMPSMTKIIFLSSIGSVLEWMDFSVYAYFAEEIGLAFFPPSSSPTTTLLESFSIFAGAFLIRPLGGIFFGWLGDRHSKKTSLLLSLLLMSLSTTGIGLLPPYSSIHSLAPFLLTLLRLLQGLAVGGQLVGTMVFVAHHATSPPSLPPSGQPASSLQGWYGGLVVASAALGCLLGSFLSFILHQTLPPSRLRSWGFRVPFLLGILVGIAAYFLHRDIPSDAAVAAEETGPGSAPPSCPPSPVHAAAAEEGGRSSFSPSLPSLPTVTATHRDSVGDEGGREKGGEEGEQTPLTNNGSAISSVVPGEGEGGRAGGREGGREGKPNPFKELFRYHKVELALATGVAALWCTGFYQCFVWLPTYLSVLVPHAPVPGAFPITTVWMGVFTLSLPFSGYLADKYGFYPVMLAGGIFITLTALPAFYFLHLGSFLPASLAPSLFVLGLSLFGGPLPLFLTHHATTRPPSSGPSLPPSLPPHLFSSVSLIYNFAQAAFGGTASLIATFLAGGEAGGGGGLGPGWWLGGVGFLSCVCLVVGWAPGRGVVSRREGGRKGGGRGMWRLGGGGKE